MKFRREECSPAGRRVHSLKPVRLISNQELERSIRLKIKTDISVLMLAFSKLSLTTFMFSDAVVGWVNKGAAGI